MLIQSKVIFNEFEHTYTLNDKQLSGVTSVIKRHLFPDMYDDIPEWILEKAAKRGTEIHSLCGLYDVSGIIDNEYEEVEKYSKLIRENGINILTSEYLVSDNENFATKIDKVDKDFNLYDIKTTRVLNREYLSWQLSINAYLFELQNPKLKAGELYGIWLKGSKAELVAINKIDKEIIKELLICDVEGREFVNPFRQLTLSDTQLLTKVSELEEFIIQQESELKTAKNKQNELKEHLVKLMDKKGLKEWDTGNVKLTRKYDSERTTVDSKALKEKHPDIYKEFSKTSTVKGTVLIKI